MKKTLIFSIFLMFLLALPLAFSAEISGRANSIDLQSEANLQQTLILDSLNISKVAFTGNTEDQTTYISFRLNNIGTNQVNNIVVTIDTDSSVPDKTFNIPSLNAGQQMLLAEHWTYTQGGNYNPTITLDYGSTTLSYPQQITIIEVNDNPLLSSFDILETTITQGDNFNANAIFSDEENTNLFFGICTTSNCNNCDINTQSGCFAYQNNAASGVNYIFSSSGLPVGNNVLYAKVCDAGNLCTTTLNDNLAVIPVNNPPTLSSFNIIETQINVGNNFNANGVFLDEDPTLFFGICTAASCSNCDLLTQTGCFAFENGAVSGVNYPFNSNNLNIGNNILYSHVCDSANLCSPILSDNLQVVATYNANGTITDIFSDLPLNNAQVKIDNNLIAYSNANGYYSFSNAAYSGYQSVRIGVSSYTPRHTWIKFQGNSGSNIEMNYTMIPLSFKWDLYNGAFRDIGIISPGIGLTTIRWDTPPMIHVFNDSSLVAINIETNFNNSLINLNTILPTFNPVEALPQNIVEEQGFGYMLQNNEVGVYWDNSIVGVGVCVCVRSGPRQLKCSVGFRQQVGCNSGCVYPTADNSVFNQEFGTAFGAPSEPPQSANYLSVFTDPTTVVTYTADDYTGIDVVLNRSKIHYRNSTYVLTDPESFDWELNPTLVQQYFPSSPSKNPSLDKSKLTVSIKKIMEDGSIKTEEYAYNDFSSEQMRMYPLLFSEDEIKEKEKTEQKRHSSAVDQKTRLVVTTTTTLTKTDVAKSSKLIYSGDHTIESYDLNNLPSDVKKYFK